MTLRPSDTRLRKLRKKVAGQLIPELAEEAGRLAGENLCDLDDQQLADAIETRRRTLDRWKDIYYQEFIPFAHGLRRLATYYNDAVHPEDPYEFVGLLRDQPLMAGERNRCIMELADQLRLDQKLRENLGELLEERATPFVWTEFRTELLEGCPGASEFVKGFEALEAQHLDIAYDQVRMQDQHEPLLRNLLELSGKSANFGEHFEGSDIHPNLTERLLAAVGPERHDEAREMIQTGRISWKLRDDDNLLIARLESQLLKSLELAASRLREQGRLSGSAHPGQSHIEMLVQALRGVATVSMRIEDVPVAESSPVAETGESPRQLVGQPASPGFATGLVRRIRGHEDLGEFRQGEVLICDAIQPTMTHLVPLASAIVERRGGMLIHGAIIARELGIPCVNGVRKAVEFLKNGDLVSVDGHLGIVTVGPAEFDLEMREDV